jgi:hypothetical protein
MKRKGRARHSISAAEALEQNAFHNAARFQRVCRECGKSKGPNGGEIPWDAHHVVEKQKLKAIGRTDLLWDPRNAMRLCKHPCHARHTNASQRVKLSALSNDNFAFAFEVLGAAAYDYLGERYEGEDPRLSDHLTKIEGNG